MELGICEDPEFCMCSIYVLGKAESSIMCVVCVEGCSLVVRFESDIEGFVICRILIVMGFMGSYELDEGICSYDGC